MFMKKEKRCTLEKIKTQLITFCESEYIDFNFRAKNISNYKLDTENLKKIMIETKKKWLESNENMGLIDCQKFAENLCKKIIR